MEAFRQMAQAKHVGKIVLVPTGPTAGAIHADATYVVTGGLGGLGLEVARWLVGRGSAKPRPDRSVGSFAARARAHRGPRGGWARVDVRSVDVSDPESVGELVDAVGDTMPPLRGIVHAAAVLDDGVLVRQDWHRFERVFAPKVLGAWNLHQATRDLPLDFFVCFSSTVALLGSPGQGNYAASNTFMDALMGMRRAAGMSGLSISWGPWGRWGSRAS